MNRKYEPYSQRRKRIKKQYGESMFRVLFYVLLITGLIVTITGFFAGEYFSLLLMIGVNTMLFSFAFKFAESVISLLKEIQGTIKN